MRAFLLASATAAILGCRRCRSLPSQRLLGSCLPPARPSAARPMDQQGAQVAIATFADAEQAITAATGPLLGYQPEPGGELATILEAFPITDRGHQRRRAQRANALDLAETLTKLTAAVEFADPP